MTDTKGRVRMKDPELKFFTWSSFVLFICSCFLNLGPRGCNRKCKTENKTPGRVWDRCVSYLESHNSGKAGRRLERHPPKSRRRESRPLAFAWLSFFAVLSRRPQHRASEFVPWPQQMANSLTKRLPEPAAKSAGNAAAGRRGEGRRSVSLLLALPRG